jgi:hypothetical protein
VGRGSAAARGQADLVRRSGDLKRELVDFAQQRRFARAFRQMARGRFGLAAVDEEVEGIFQVKRRQGGALVADNLVDGLTYRVRSNMGPAALATVRPGSFLIARLLPVGDQWLLSGVASMLPAGSCVEAGPHEMFVLTRWERGTLAVPLAQLEAVGVDEPTRQAMQDWQYWVARYELSIRAADDQLRKLAVAAGRSPAG